MEYKKLHRFILLVLLCEGKSNVWYLVCRFVFGEKAAIRRYFKILFTGCDNATFMHYLDLYNNENNTNLSIKVGLNSNNLLIGEIED